VRLLRDLDHAALSTPCLPRPDQEPAGGQERQEGSRTGSLTTSAREAWARSRGLGRHPREGRVRRAAPHRPGQAGPLPPTPPRRHLPTAAPDPLPDRAAHPGRGRTPHQRRHPRLPGVPGPAGPPPDPARRGPPQGRHRPHRRAHRPLRPPARLPGALVHRLGKRPPPTPRRPPAAHLQPRHGRGRLGAQFLIFTSLPRNDDLNLLLSAAQAAWDGRRGAWAEFGDTLLLAYEYRACIKLGVAELNDPAAAIAEAYQRLCVDLRDLRLVGKFDYSRSHQANDCGSGRTTSPRPAKTSASPPSHTTTTPS
jgi:hypothetical protein